MIIFGFDSGHFNFFNSCSVSCDNEEVCFDPNQSSSNSSTPYNGCANTAIDYNDYVLTYHNRKSQNHISKECNHWEFSGLDKNIFNEKRYELNLNYNYCKNSELIFGENNENMPKQFKNRLICYVNDRDGNSVPAACNVRVCGEEKLSDEYFAAELFEMAEYELNEFWTSPAPEIETTTVPIETTTVQENIEKDQRNNQNLDKIDEDNATLEWFTEWHENNERRKDLAKQNANIRVRYNPSIQPTVATIIDQFDQIESSGNDGFDESEEDTITQEVLNELDQIFGSGDDDIHVSHEFGEDGSGELLELGEFSEGSGSGYMDDTPFLTLLGDY